MPEGTEQSPGSGPRLVRAWAALNREQHLAAAAAVLLFVTMLLPWYQQNAIVSASKTAPLVSNNLTAFQAFSFVEFAVLLVAAAVLVLLFARAEGRSFHLPGSDGAVLFAAGIWTALLLVFRLFDKPGITHNGVAANVGIQWGIFFALAAAGLLAYAGSRMRAAQRPEPPALLRRDGERPARRQATSDRPGPRPGRRDLEPSPERSDPTRPTRLPEPDEPHAQREPHTLRESQEHAAEETTIIAARRKRPRFPPAPAKKPAPSAATRAGAEQLSFEDGDPGA
jgi:hypothetical protein